MLLQSIRHDPFEKNCWRGWATEDILALLRLLFWTILPCCHSSGLHSAAGGFELSTTTHVKTAWKKFKELIPGLSSRHLSFKTHGHVYSLCVRRAMLHASETWPLTKPSLQRLQRKDTAMIRQICNVKPQDTATIRSTELLARLGIEDLDLILKERSSWQRGIAESGSSQLLTLMIETPGDLVWDLRCVQQASCLEGGPLLWIWPLYLHVNKKSDDDDDDAPTALSQSLTMVWTRAALTLHFRTVAYKAACHTLSKASLKSMKTRHRLCRCWRQLSHRTPRLKICSVAPPLARNPAWSPATISSAWGLSLSKMTFSTILLKWWGW